MLYWKAGLPVRINHGKDEYVFLGFGKRIINPSFSYNFVYADDENRCIDTKIANCSKDNIEVEVILSKKLT